MKRKTKRKPSLLDCPGCGKPGNPKSDDGTWVQIICQNTARCDYDEPYQISSRELNKANDERR